MSDSDDSDYNVEDFVTPDTIRRTYNNGDLLSDDEDDSGSSKSESEGNSDSDVKNQQCKLKNGDNEDESNGQPVSTMRSRSTEEPRTNSRFILYCTNLSATTTRSMLEDFFADAGPVKSIRIPKVRLGNFAFVEMKDVDGFKAGLKFNNRELDERKIQVYPGSKNKKHASNKSKGLKRKAQQTSLNKIKEQNKLRKQATNE